MTSVHLISARDSSLKMEKYMSIKTFITAASEYIKNSNETTASVLQRNLNTLCTITDPSVFDPGSLIITEFYVSLYNLINRTVSGTSIVWSVVDVLQHACKNSAARHTLIHAYKFSPLLTRLLETNLIPEKRLRILKLLQELTYDENIHWQEANFPNIISILTQWIMQSKEEEILTLSLGVLINICHKNLSAIHTLMRTVDIKALHRRILKLQHCSINTRVQCYKLFIVLEQINKDIPDKFILEFTMITFQSLIAALANSDVFILKHIVRFYEDVRQNEHSKSVLVTYPNYVKDVTTILEELERISHPECTALVMEFLLSLVKLKISSLIPLYSIFMKVAMHQVPVNYASSKALALMRTILIDSKRSRIFPDLVSELDLSVLMLVIDDEDDEMNGKSEKQSIELDSRLIELMQLLQEMCKIPNFRAQVTVAFNEQIMRKLLRPVFEQENLMSNDDWPGSLFHDATKKLYIYALFLTADLAVQDSNWLTLYSELIQKKQIQMIIALSLFTGDSEIKQKCLQLMTSVGFPQECVTNVAKCMSELEPLILIKNKTGITTSAPMKSQNNPYIDVIPLFPLVQEGQLGAALEKLNDLLDEGKITDISTSAIMELYEYKLAAMRHAERGLEASREAANAHAICLQHRLTQVVAESNRLHQLLFHTQQNNDLLQQDKIRMNSKIQEMEIESKNCHAMQRQEIQGLKKIVTEKSATIEQLSKLKHDLEVATNKIGTLKAAIKNMENEKIIIKEKAKEMSAKNHDLNNSLNKLKDSITKKDQILETKQREVEEGQEAMSALKQENEQLMRQCRTYEQVIAEKEENNHKMETELVELSRMRDMIYHLTAKKKDEPNATT